MTLNVDRMHDACACDSIRISRCCLLIASGLDQSAGCMRVIPMKKQVHQVDESSAASDPFILLLANCSDAANERRPRPSSLPASTDEPASLGSGIE